METGGSPPFRDHRAFYLTSVTVSDGACCSAQRGSALLKNKYNVRFAIANRFKTILVVMLVFLDLFLFCLNEPCANPIAY